MILKLIVTIAGCLLVGGCATQEISAPIVDDVVVEKEIPQGESEQNIVGPTVCKDDSCVSIMIADTPDARTQGLMYRTELGPNKGMLFVFDKEHAYAFWMKNTLIPLDMIWIDSKLMIVDIQTATPCEGDPCPTYQPAGKSLYVLEINAGRAAELGRKSGDGVTINE